MALDELVVVSAPVPDELVAAPVLPAACYRQEAALLPGGDCPQAAVSLPVARAFLARVPACSHRDVPEPDDPAVDLCSAALRQLAVSPEALPGEHLNSHLAGSHRYRQASLVQPVSLVRLVASEPASAHLLREA